eukprot:scaffold998_cov411-Prasinococcus_capsulatus_cf.AAC.9
MFFPVFSVSSLGRLHRASLPYRGASAAPRGPDRGHLRVIEAMLRLGGPRPMPPREAAAERTW